VWPFLQKLVQKLVQEWESERILLSEWLAMTNIRRSLSRTASMIIGAIICHLNAVHDLVRGLVHDLVHDLLGGQTPPFLQKWNRWKWFLVVSPFLPKSVQKLVQEWEPPLAQQWLLVVWPFHEKSVQKLVQEWEPPLVQQWFLLKSERSQAKQKPLL
jgi:hypothetical protein